MRKEFYNPEEKQKKRGKTRILYLILQPFNHKNTITLVFNVIITHHV